MFKSFNPGPLGIKCSFEESLALAASAGFEGVDLPLGAAAKIVEKGSPDDVKEMYERHGLRIGGWGLSVNFRDTEEVFEEGLKGFERLVKVAAALGSPWCSTWITPGSDTLDFQSNFELHATRLRECARILKKYDCRLGLEFVGPWTSRKDKKYPFVFDQPGMLKLGDAIGTGNVGLLMDCWHWYTSFGTVHDLLALKSWQVVNVHVNDAPAGIPADEQLDNVRCLPAETGVIDIASFLKALALIGYDGPVMVEPFNQELREVAKDDGGAAARKTGEALQKAWESAGL